MPELKRTSYEYEYQNKKYKVTVEKPIGYEITLYVGEYLFLNQLTKEYPLKSFFMSQGKITPYEQGKIDNLKLIKIVEIKDPKKPEQPMFKELVV